MHRDHAYRLSCAGYLVLFVTLMLAGPAAMAVPMEVGAKVPGYAETFGVPAEGAGEPAVRVVLVRSNAAGNIFYPGQGAEFEIQLQNLTEQAQPIDGHLEVIGYRTLGWPANTWQCRYERIDVARRVPLRAELKSGGHADVKVALEDLPRNGGYGLVADLGPAGRQVVTTFIRTFEPDGKRVQYPQLGLEHVGADILGRLGVRGVRYGLSFDAADKPRRKETLERLKRDMEAFHANRVTVIAEVGSGDYAQPLDRGRPHLDGDGVMKRGKMDLSWMPSEDDDYEQFVFEVCREYGWPKGPIVAMKLWNEPWEGGSISGWQADMPRYRELYKRMGDAVFKARREAGVDVLVGAADSTANTWDKLFPEGLERSPFWPAYLDFCSIHYQGTSSPSLYRAWVERTHHKGRVLVWDTESWVANSDEKVAGMIATCLAAGYDRVVGTYRGVIRNPEPRYGPKKVPYWTEEGRGETWLHAGTLSTAAAYAAAQHLIGERRFKEFLFEGLPWVFVFEGMEGNADDGTVVVLGDIGRLLTGHDGQMPYRTARGLAEVREKESLLAQKEQGGLDTEALRVIDQQLQSPRVREGRLVLAASSDYAVLDVYGNPMVPVGGRHVLPLGIEAWYLRATPGRAGAFGRLLEALRSASVEEIEPVEMIPVDLLKPVKEGATLRVRVKNVMNRPVAGEVRAAMQDCALAPAVQAVELAPHETKWVEFAVKGEGRGDNQYALALRFEVGGELAAVHRETMRVNVVARKSIEVDGELQDWAGALPQTVSTGSADAPSATEAAWLPFVAKAEGAAGGIATGYVAYDDEYFYVACKTLDTSPHAGTIRYAKRDDDAYYYPEVAYEVGRDGKRVEHRWPAGVRRFTFREFPPLPAGSGQVKLDNVLVAFNVIPLEEEPWLPVLPGRPIGFIGYKCTDYQYALNKVADAHGGGTEVWRLETPGMPRKHYYPRQPKHPLEGAVEGAKLVVRRDGDTLITECAIPWTEIPHVRQRMQARQPVKFSFCVNNDRGPSLELAQQRGISRTNPAAFQVDWRNHWANEIEFAWE